MAGCSWSACCWRCTQMRSSTSTTTWPLRRASLVRSSLFGRLLGEHPAKFTASLGMYRKVIAAAGTWSSSSCERGPQLSAGRRRGDPHLRRLRGRADEGLWRSFRPAGLRLDRRDREPMQLDLSSRRWSGSRGTSAEAARDQRPGLRGRGNRGGERPLGHGDAPGSPATDRRRGDASARTPRRRRGSAVSSCFSTWDSGSSASPRR